MSDALASKPSRMIVSLQVGGIFFALANVICVAILAWAWLSVRLEPKTLNVTGSAHKDIDSDLITWSASYTAWGDTLPAAYDKLKADQDKVAAFLKQSGIPDGNITFSQISTSKTFVKREVPQPAINGVPQPSQWVDTDQVKMFSLTQTVKIESQDMKRVPEVARSITSLIKDGIEIDSGSPEYLYTKLSELKINMLAEATKDATNRATQIVTNANGHLGKLVEARMGVMQINPKGSSATSAEGNNDTTSFQKEITAVVEARFELR
ncbi:MAG TPA: SIMPL domain-containing protein [Phycisphaerae bacterium]|nr:SIMPL domain-containing protein [Phycisphaerae bacterium]